MMAESKFSEAQKSLELLLSHAPSVDRVEVLTEYVAVLELQSKSLPPHIIIELAESLPSERIDESMNLIEKLVPPFDRRRVLLVRIKNAAQKGKLQELYSLISELQTYLYEVKAPAIPASVSELVGTYFKSDFQLKLQELSLHLMLFDLKRSEELIVELILSCVERTSAKGFQEKLASLEVILSHREARDHLDIYQNLCRLLLQGVQDKSDYKKIVECVIYFDDFRLQVMILNLLDRLGLRDLCGTYSKIVKNNPDYDFVYFDKFYAGLKHYFVSPKSAPRSPESPLPQIDLSLEKTPIAAELPTLEVSFSADEADFIHPLKYRDHSAEELLEIAVSFIQSEMPVAGLHAASLALDKATAPELFLKAAFLKMTCLLKTGDFRGALDLSFTALDKSQREEDILSFLYTQAEAFQRLGQKREAKRVLQKIVSIDRNYRLARERLERLDEV